MTRLKGDCDLLNLSCIYFNLIIIVGEHDPIKRGLRPLGLINPNDINFFKVGEHDPIKRGLRQSQ